MTDNDNHSLKIRSSVLLWAFAIGISVLLGSLLLFGSGVAFGLFFGQKQFYIEHFHNETSVPMGLIRQIEDLKFEELKRKLTEKSEKKVEKKKSTKPRRKKSK